MILFKNICFSYTNEPLLQNLTFEVLDGEHVCLFGKSGCGKSTIIQLILGFNKPNSGEILNTHKTFSTCFQDNRFIENKTIKQNLELVHPKLEIDQLLNELGVYETKDLYPKELSGGMARRVSLARALLYDAPLLLLDEPFNGLDEQSYLDSIKVVKKYAKDKTIILITHNPKQAQDLECRMIEID